MCFFGFMLADFALIFDDNEFLRKLHQLKDFNQTLSSKKIRTLPKKESSLHEREKKTSLPEREILLLNQKRCFLKVDFLTLLELEGFTPSAEEESSNLSGVVYRFDLPINYLKFD